jgi:glycine/D-amino acid oxidase-like deaminating enzyme/nitrite reductase/ring-hydroxylating ferredoxin subunit
MTAPDGPVELAGAAGSYWRATSSRPATGPLLGPRTADVAVVGGGIVGLVTAVLAARAGRQVLLLEALELGAGTTGGTTGKVTVQNGTRLHTLRRRFGDDGAATYARASLRGIDLLDQLVHDHGIACDLEVADAHLVALTDEQADPVRAEAAATTAAGVACHVGTAPDELPLTAGLTLTVPDQRQLHAQKLLHGLADALVALGGDLHERSRVVDLRSGRPRGRRWELATDRGSVAADHVVLATRLPLRDRRGLFGRTKPVSAVGVAAAMEGDSPRGMYLLEGARTWSVRGSRPDDGSERLVAVGMSEATGDRRALDDRTGRLEGWLRARWPVTEVEHRWMAQDQVPADGRPLIGTVGGEGVLAATGFGKWGLALGIAAGELLVSTMQDLEDPYAGFFRAGRIDPPSSWGTLLAANLRVGALVVGDRLRTPLGDPELAPGEGRVVREGRRPVAIARDEDGTLHRVAATCTHLGCLVRWNAQQHTWDCGCHGSRFAIDGTVLEAPATEPLPPVEG